MNADKNMRLTGKVILFVLCGYLRDTDWLIFVLA